MSFYHIVYNIDLKTNIEFLKEMDEQPHLRFNPLKDEWVVVSPHRTKRPWKGQVEKQQETQIPRRDLNNPLVPSAVRASGAKNPEYSGVYVFENDFPALLQERREGGKDCDDTDGGLFQSAPAQGTCRVMCFHPWSDMILPLMDTKDVVKVVEEWIRQFVELSKKYRWVQVWLDCTSWLSYRKTITRIHSGIGRLPQALARL